LRSARTNILNNTTNVEFSLSIHGNKQTSNVVNLSLKNYHGISSGEGGVKETLDKIGNIVEKRKGLIYQNNHNFFFIFAPEKTRTFRNQETALDIAKEIAEIMENHNKLFKNKIEYGISVDEGDVILGQEKGEVKFTAVNSLIINLKKMSSTANKQIILSEKVRNDLASRIKADRVPGDKVHAYVLREVVSKPDHSKFIRGFMERMEKDKRIQQNNSK